MKNLLVAGMLLFLIGLVSGFFIPIFENQAMSQTAHLIGIQNGIVLVIFGLTINILSLSTRSLGLLTILSIYGMYGIWLSIALSATTIKKTENSTFALKEVIENFLLYSGSIAIIIATILIILNLVRNKF